MLCLLCRLTAVLCVLCPAQERDLNNFMDGFPGLKAAKAAEAQAKQDATVALLDRIGKLQQLATSNLPSQKKFKEMQVNVVLCRAGPGTVRCAAL